MIQINYKKQILYKPKMPLNQKKQKDIIKIYKKVDKLKKAIISKNTKDIKEKEE